MLFSNISIWLILFIPICFIVRRLQAWLTYRSKMLTHNCAPPSYYNHIDPILGYDLYLKTTEARASGNLMPVLQSLYRRYGKTFQAKFLGVDVIYTSDPQNIQAMNTTFFENFLVRPLRAPANGDWVGEGVFISDGEMWRHARKIVMPVFARANVADLQGFGALLGKMMDLLPEEGETVDLRPLFRRLFLDSSTAFLFGESRNTLSPDGSSKLDAEKFLESFDKAMAGVDRRMSLAGLSFLYGRATKDAEWKEAIATVHGYVEIYIDRALEERASSSDDEKADQEEKTKPFACVLDELVKVTQDRKFIRDQLISLFFPSRDATGIGLSGLFFNLARNPRVWTKVREEVISSLGPEQPLTFENLKSLRYLQSVLNESLRLLAPASMGARVCVTDTVLPHGGSFNGLSPILIQAGTKIDMNFGVMQRDPDAWGPNAESFRPERWQTPDFRPKWEYIPFLGGGRICPAQQMVLNQLGFVLATFVRRYERIESRDPEERFVEEYIFSVQSRNGVKVAFGMGEGKKAV